MTFHELTKAIAEHANITHKMAFEVVRQVFKEIGDDVAEGGRVAIPEFGIFETRTRKPRRIRSPKTKELIRLPRSYTLGFRASKHRKGRR